MNHHRNRHIATDAGFSLIELMVVIAIIGVLSSAAIPAYQDYIVRSKVTNMLAMAQYTKLAVAESVIVGTPLNVEPIKNRDPVKEIAVKDHVITIIGETDKLGIKITGEQPKELKLILKPDLENATMITWKCSVEPVDFSKYVPAECRAS